MSSNLSIQYLGGRSTVCAALASMRERGVMVSRTAVRATFGPRLPSPANVVMSGDGGHLVAAISKSRSDKPWIALLNQEEVERMRPWQAGARARGWFPRLMQGADAVVLPSDTALEAWKQWVPESASRVFRIYPTLERSGTNSSSRGDTRSPIRVGVATDSRGPSGLGALASILEVFSQRCPELRSSFEIRVSKAPSREDSALAQRLGIELKLSKEELSQSDLVVVLDRGNALPGAFFDALHSGRPVLSLSRSAEASRILAKTGLGLQIECGQRAWAEKGAAVLQRAVFRRSLRRPLLPEYSPRPGALGEFSVSHFCAQLEEICRDLLAPKLLSPVKLAPELSDRQALP